MTRLGEAQRAWPPLPNPRRRWLASSLRPRPLQRIDGWLRTHYVRLRHRDSFDRVERYCMFVGYPRSGHTLVGSLLNAHPQMLIAHEADVLGLVDQIPSRNLLFAHMLLRDKYFQSLGRQWTGYSYLVPDQWQGRFTTLRVVGDKQGGLSAHRLSRDPSLIGRLRTLVDMPLRIIHHIRNPYDVITTYSRARSVPLERAADFFFLLCGAVQKLRTGLHESEFLDTWHEQFVAEPARHLSHICRFLGVETTEDYLKSCASLVFPAAKQSRRTMPWDVGLIESVKHRMQDYPYLSGYDFET